MSGLDIPLSLRDRLRESDPLFLGVVWLPAFLIIQYLALGLAMEVHGSGFDDCEGGAAVGSDVVQQAIAGAALALSVGLALSRVRGALLLVALVTVAIAGSCWWILLGSSQIC